MDISLNNQIAMKLQEMSDLLEQQGANPFRIKAYRQAAITLTDLGQDVADILQREGSKGLESLPGIGRGIATAIAEIVTRGHWAQLERLRGSLDPIHLFQTVPGIGPELAVKIHDWVVIYFYDDHHQEGQQTLVTETHGPLQGRRGVRGREFECQSHYRT